jgi:P4 family phage/plasmid primase-like protien
METDRTTESQQAAERYIRSGFAPIPVPAGEKNPNRAGWQHERHVAENIPVLWSNGQNVGILCGEPSGGLADVDLDTKEARIAAAHILPPTRTSGRESCPASHKWYYPDPLPKTKAYKLSGKGIGRSVVELRSTGVQTLVYPSRHPSGDRYVWADETAEISRIDGEQLSEAVADVATAALIARNWPGPGARHDYALAAAGYIGRHTPRQRAERIMQAAVAASGDEEAADRTRGVADTLDKLAAGSPTTGGPTLGQLAPGVVERLTLWHKWGSGSEPRPEGTERPADENPEPAKQGTPTHDELRDRWLEAPETGLYAHGLGEWRRYEAGIWPAVAETTVKAGVSRTVEAAKTEGIRPTASIVSSVYEMARIKAFVADEVWDADPNILVCENGALRISTRELGEHKPEHHATSAVPYDYEPGKRPIVWYAFLEETVGDKVAAFLQEFAGYALTTDTSHELAVWLHGPRGSGKSTFIEGLKAMLGPRAGVLGLADLERSRFSLASLPGKTLMVAREQPSSYLASTDVLDTIISGEELTVERKYHDPYSIIPRAKLCWAMNELPRVANTSAGLFRRVRVVSFPELEPERRDPDIKRFIQNEGAGILNWALEGLHRLRERGRFEIPAAVQQATAEFEKRNDVPAIFLDAECVRGAGESISAQRLYEAYKGWCEDNGHRPLSSTKASDEWQRLGLDRDRPRSGTVYHGARLKMPTEKFEDA